MENAKKKGLANAHNIDVSNAPTKLQDKLKDIHERYADVFAPDLTIGYNGAAGSHKVRLQFADENRPQTARSHVP